MSKDKKLLMAALLAVAVSTQGLAQPEALSEDELEEVSAQGLQIVENHNATFGNLGPLNSQNNNLDSVQGNDTSMRKANIGYGAVLANSAVNSTSNYLYDAVGGGTTPPPPPPPPGGGGGKTFSHSFEQTNENTAKNHYNHANLMDTGEVYATAANINKQTQLIGTNVEDENELTIVSQNNNNNSVQLNNSSQRNSTGMVLINAAASAVNAGDNLFYASSVDGTQGSQSNLQTAKNFENFSESEVTQAKSYNKEESKKAQIVSNGGLTLSHDDTKLSKKINIQDQNNNNNSVQLNDNAQREASFVAIKNTANSAANNGVNAAYIANGLTNSEIIQSNEQTAQNHLNYAKVQFDTGTAEAYNENKQGQLIDNASAEIEFVGNAEIISQNNNNNSVQLNNNAQRQASGVIIENAAMSAVNKGVNLIGVGEITSSTLSQSNNQTAKNFDNTAESIDVAMAYNAENGSAQEIINEIANIIEQDNNNNTVQLNDDAQRNATGIVIENVANSAENTGINVLSGGDLITLEAAQAGAFKGTLGQNNTQTAKNHDNNATGSSEAEAVNVNKERQIVSTYNRNIDLYLNIEDQDNNNNSVQLNGNAQYEAIGGVISNASMSANNIGVNVMAVGDIENSGVEQLNTQTASNFNNTANGGTLAKASNMESGATQDIDNMNEYTSIIDMDNNNNSVQLNNNAQRKAQGIVIANTANSATNTGLNGMITGNIVGDLDADAPTEITQLNTQTANNHLNTATAGETAAAYNLNKQTQVIRNFTVDDPNNLAYIERQNNNNNSVQLNNSAQRETVSMVMENASLSGTNIGVNLLTTGDVNVPPTHVDPSTYGNVTDSVIIQSNDQTATNFNNEAEGDNAYALNGEYTDGVFFRTDEPEAGQMIENIHGYIPTEGVQNNNNNSVQLNDNAQAKAQGLIISNIANSAANIAVNMMNTGDITNTSITQENVQIAKNHVNFADGYTSAFAGNLNKQKQYIYNCNCTAIDGEQNNNMNSVQLNGNAQAEVAALTLVNSANSAANIGINLLHAGTVSGSTIVQRNTATAENFTNTADGITAKAINAENFTNPLPW
ncbi:beta strand repeat-containing protein [Persephonella sp.]